MKNKAN